MPARKPRSEKSPIFANGIATLALIVATVFGTGAWVGQRYGNSFAQKNYELGVIVACADHPVLSLIQDHDRVTDLTRLAGASQLRFMSGYTAWRAFLAS